MFPHLPIHVALTIQARLVATFCRLLGAKTQTLIRALKRRNVEDFKVCAKA